ncbi:hypothetical protein [Methylobacterium durans]|uniref:Uncharacterized protein n=1 Tax=Methylobacterium durans TaxID=2202825 RepID=A0A2U8WED6_9HYPH|nr:hypothetical protein [Methylobacterium durans]AWN43898.1 hypothetical protein DK389_29525 [Methylobacterium durans]
MSGDRPSRSGIPVLVELRADHAIARPVSLAQALRRFGLDLEQAHGALNDIKARHRVRLELYVCERSGPPDDFQEFGLDVRLVEAGSWSGFHDPRIMEAAPST